MHLAIVHQEKVKVKKEPNSFENEPNFGGKTEVYRCEPCDSSFESQITLDQHNRSYHKKDKQFTCELCDCNFSQKGCLKSHVASVHEQKKSFKCEICDYSCSKKNFSS